MRNNYLNLDVDDLAVTDIIIDHKNKLNKSMTPQEFKDVIIELNNIRHDNLAEIDEELIADIFNDLNKKYESQIRSNLLDSTVMNDNQTVGELMYFLSRI
jgi:predicted DNA-binding protein (UPF0278 family)